MSEFNRNQFKGASLNSIREEQGKAEKAIPKNDSFSGRPGFHTVLDGKNWRRIAPAHNPSDPAYCAKSTVSLECEVPEIDDNGKETGKREVKKKNIFIATQHSSKMKEDPVLLYIQFVEKQITDIITDKNDRAKALAPINGWRGKDTKWNWGIRPSLEYVCYCWDDKGVLGREQLYPSMLESMKKISVERSSDNTEIIPDIFTDPDEGYPLIITKTKNDKGKTEYLISCDMPSRTESWNDFFSRTRITDEQLKELVGKESLRELYKEAYTTRDFDMAIDGLKRFDEQYKYGVFKNEEFIEMITNLRKIVPVYSPKESDQQSSEPQKPKSEENKVGTSKADSSGLKKEFDKVGESTNALPAPIPAMKNFIKSYIQENYGSDYSMPELNKEQLIVWYNLSKVGEELPFETLSKESVPEGNTMPQVEREEGKKVIDKVGSEKVNEQKIIDNVPVKDDIADMDPELKAQIEALRGRNRSK